MRRSRPLTVLGATQHAALLLPAVAVAVTGAVSRPAGSVVSCPALVAKPARDAMVVVP